MFFNYTGLFENLRLLIILGIFFYC